MWLQSSHPLQFQAKHEKSCSTLVRWIISSLPRHGLHDAVEVLQRAVLQYDAAFAVAVGNRDPHPQRATQVLLRFADIWVHNALLFGRGTRLNQVSNQRLRLANRERIVHDLA